MEDKKKATTVEQQIEKLTSRGLIIRDEAKAKEILLDIGYYRFCSYLFPFEKAYPSKKRRTHDYVEGTTLEDGLALYYFDFEIRRLLLKYLFRIEVNVRTYITYYVSNFYADEPCWFVKSGIMSSSYINNFNRTYYNNLRRNNSVIIDHHRNHPRHKYAPAWKTIEQMPFGNVQFLFENIMDDSVRHQVALYYGVDKLEVFTCYIDCIRRIRNNCAHGSVVFDMKLPKPLHNGPAGKFTPFTNSNIIGIIEVMKFFLKRISVNRHDEFCMDFDNLINQVDNPKIAEVLSKVSGFTLKKFCR